MSEVTTIGLDLAKHVFHVHGVAAEGAAVLRRRPRREQVLAFFSKLPPCVVGDWKRVRRRTVGHAVVLYALRRRAPGRRWRELVFPHACRIRLEASSPKGQLAVDGLPQPVLSTQEPAGVDTRSRCYS